jgi:hypothetical protein
VPLNASGATRTGMLSAMAKEYTTLEVAGREVRLSAGGAPRVQPSKARHA